MRLPSRLMLAFFCLLLAAPVFAQGSPVVYVSTGTTILSVNAAAPGAVSTLVSNAAATYEGLVVGPDNTGTSQKGYLLYACDPTNNQIIRFDPNNPPTSGGTKETVYGGMANSPLQKPQCGRFDSAGDLIVNSEVAGSGAWKIPGVISVKLGAGGFQGPTKLNTAISAAELGQGITQKYIGDLLAVDQAGNQIVRSTIQPLAPPLTSYNFGPSSAFINSNLSSPIGIARDNSGLVYVSEHTTRKNGDVQLFDSTGTFVKTCVTKTTFGNQQPNFLGVAEDGTLYVATAAANSGGIWQVTAAGACNATQLATTTALSPLTGLALPPTTVTLESKQAGAGTLEFNFGSSVFFVTTGACDLTLTKSLVPIPTLNAAAATLTGNQNVDNVMVTLNGGVDAPYLGDSGFGSDYFASSTIADPDSCPPQPSEFKIAAFTDQLAFPNPRLIQCDPNIVGTCNANLGGIYYLGGFLPEDITITKTGSGHSDFFTADMNLSNSEKGVIVLESPLKQVPPPQLAGTFSSGSNLALKLKFNPTITDAVVLVAISQICQPGTTSATDPVCGPNNQATVFPINIINLNAEGSSTAPPPLIKADKNQQYQISISLKGYAQGIYSLSVIPITGQAPNVTVIFKVI